MSTYIIEVFAMLVDPEFQRQRCSATGALESSVEITGDPSAPLVRCRRRMATEGVADFVRRVVGSSVEVLDELARRGANICVCPCTEGKHLGREKTKNSIQSFAQASSAMESPGWERTTEFVWALTATTESVSGEGEERQSQKFISPKKGCWRRCAGWPSAKM